MKKIIMSFVISLLMMHAADLYAANGDLTVNGNAGIATNLTVSGKVGIGTTSPQASLDIGGNPASAIGSAIC